MKKILTVFVFALIIGACQTPSISTPSANSSYRYTDNGDGTVTDDRTALVWLKNANCFGEQDWNTAMQSAANLASGQCGLQDGSKRGMWRLPTIADWRAMMDKEYREPVLSNAAGTGKWTEGDAFSRVQTSRDWSSVPYASDTGSVWSVFLSDGRVNTNSQTSTYYVWPVRRRHSTNALMP